MFFIFKKKNKFKKIKIKDICAIFKIPKFKGRLEVHLKKILMLAGAVIISAVSFADLENTIRNNYANKTIDLTTFQKTREIKSGGAAVEGVREQIINFAQTKLGSPYVWGATGPTHLTAQDL